MKFASIVAVSALASLLAVAPSAAATQTYTAPLTGAAEVPANDSAGIGQVSADFDTETKLLKWNITYEDLTGPATAAHFHGPADPDVNAPPVIPVDEADLAAGVAEDNKSGSISGEATLSDEQAADLRAGKWYFNIHTAAYPEGELRGQLPIFAE
jgi:hypothetical protein